MCLTKIRLLFIILPCKTKKIICVTKKKSFTSFNIALFNKIVLHFALAQSCYTLQDIYLLKLIMISIFHVFLYVVNDAETPAAVQNAQALEKRSTADQPASQNTGVS